MHHLPSLSTTCIIYPACPPHASSTQPVHHMHHLPSLSTTCITYPACPHMHHLPSLSITCIIYPARPSHASSTQPVHHMHHLPSLSITCIIYPACPPHASPTQLSITCIIYPACPPHASSTQPVHHMHHLPSLSIRPEWCTAQHCPAPACRPPTPHSPAGVESVVRRQVYVPAPLWPRPARVLPPLAGHHIHAHREDLQVTLTGKGGRGRQEGGQGEFGWG